MRRDVQITPNFRLSEFIRNEDPMPDETVLENILMLANRLQVIRDLFGAPIKINSGYRTPEHNKAVGGKSKSLHLYGMAADIEIKGIGAREVQKRLKNWSGGMGSYETFTHLDIRPNRARW